MSLSTMSTHLLNTSRDGDSATFLGSLFQCLTTLPVKKFFLISNLNLTWVQLEAVSSCRITCYLKEETNTHLAAASFQVVVESDKVSLQPPFLQTKHNIFAFTYSQMFIFHKSLLETTAYKPSFFCSEKWIQRTKISRSD